MTCPKCQFQNPEGENVCQQCQMALPIPVSSTPPLTFNQPSPTRHSSWFFALIGGLAITTIVVLIAVGSYNFKNNQERNVSSSSTPTTGVATKVPTKDMPVFSGNNCISDEVYKKFGELTQDLEMFSGTKTFETTVTPGPLPADFPSQLSPHPAMKLCWVSKASPEFGKDIMDGFSFISYSILFSVNADLTEIADWYQKQFLSQGLNVSDDTEVSKSIHQHNTEKFKQAGVNTFDLEKVLVVTLPNQEGVFPIKAGITFVRVNGVPGVQISYAKISR